MCAVGYTGKLCASEGLLGLLCWGDGCLLRPQTHASGHCHPCRRGHARHLGGSKLEPEVQLRWVGRWVGGTKGAMHSTSEGALEPEVQLRWKQPAGAIGLPESGRARARDRGIVCLPSPNSAGSTLFCYAMTDQLHSNPT